MWRKGFIGFLLLSFSLQALGPSLLPLRFLLQREAIIENWCINKNEPVLLCSGTCYLLEQMEEHQSEDEQSHRLQELRLLTLALPAELERPFRDATFPRQQPNHAPKLSAQNWTGLIFHPPRFEV